MGAEEAVGDGRRLRASAGRDGRAHAGIVRDLHRGIPGLSRVVTVEREGAVQTLGESCVDLAIGRLGDDLRHEHRDREHRQNDDQQKEERQASAKAHLVWVGPALNGAGQRPMHFMGSRP